LGGVVSKGVWERAKEKPGKGGSPPQKKKTIPVFAKKRPLKKGNKEKEVAGDSDLEKTADFSVPERRPNKEEKNMEKVLERKKDPQRPRVEKGTRCQQRGGEKSSS